MRGFSSPSTSRFCTTPSVLSGNASLSETAMYSEGASLEVKQVALAKLPLDGQTWSIARSRTDALIHRTGRPINGLHLRCPEGEAEQRIVNAMKSSAATALVKGLQMIQLQSVHCRRWNVLDFRSMLQDQHSGSNGFADKAHVPQRGGRRRTCTTVLALYPRRQCCWKHAVSGEELRCATCRTRAATVSS